MAKATAKRTPPTETKLLHLVQAISAFEQAAGGSEASLSASMSARDAIRKIYKNGLPSGIDPTVVGAAIALVMPLCYELSYLTKKAGTEYDAAIVCGVRAHRERHGLSWVLEPALVAALTEHTGVSIKDANQRLLLAERAVDRDPETNLPSDRSADTLERVRSAMEPWFAPDVISDTLSLARQGMPPTRWDNGEGATPPQGDEEWALFIACALHPSEEAFALISRRAKLIPLLEEPARSAVCDVLRVAGHASLVP